MFDMKYRKFPQCVIAGILACCLMLSLVACGAEKPAPQQPQEAHPSMGVDFWMWILVVIMAFCAGCITILLINGIRRK